MLPFSHFPTPSPIAPHHPMKESDVTSIVVTNAIGQARTDNIIRSGFDRLSIQAAQDHNERIASESATQDVIAYWGSRQHQKLEDIRDAVEQGNQDARDREQRQIEREENKELLELAAIEARRQMLMTERTWAQKKSALQSWSPESREQAAAELLQLLKAIDVSDAVLKCCDRISAQLPDFALQSPQQKQRMLWAEIHPVYARVTEELLSDATEGFFRRRTQTLADHTGSTPGAKMHRTLDIMNLVAQTSRFLATPVAYFPFNDKHVAPFRSAMAELEASLDPEYRDVVWQLATQRLLDRDDAGAVSPELERKLTELFVPGLARAFGLRLQCTRTTPRPAVAIAEELEKYEPLQRDDSRAEPPARIGLSALCLVVVMVSWRVSGVGGLLAGLFVGLVVLAALNFAERSFGRWRIRRQEAAITRRRNELRHRVEAANTQAQNELNTWLASGRTEREQVRAAYGRAFPALTESLDAICQDADVGNVLSPVAGSTTESATAELRQWERECPALVRKLNLALAYFTYGAVTQVEREFTATTRPDSSVFAWEPPRYPFPETETAAVVWKSRLLFTPLFIAVCLSGPGLVTTVNTVHELRAAQKAADEVAAAAILQREAEAQLKKAEARLKAVEEAFTGKPERSFDEIAELFGLDGHFKGELQQRLPNGDTATWRLIIRVGWAGEDPRINNGKISAMDYFPALRLSRGLSGEISPEHPDEKGCSIHMVVREPVARLPYATANALEHISYHLKLAKEADGHIYMQGTWDDPVNPKIGGSLRLRLAPLEDNRLLEER